MIYLVTQMLLCIALAGLLGGAIGWLIQRSRSTATVGALRNTVAQQRAQVEQARTDVSLITQDYDELKQHSRSEIERLQQENKRLPALNQNLEKSQTLVRQLMQKHEAQLRDLGAEKDSLAQRLSMLTDRDEAYRKVSAELDAARRRLVTIEPGEQSNLPVAEQAPASRVAPAAAVTASEAAAGVAATVASGSSWASARSVDVTPTDASLEDVTLDDVAVEPIPVAEVSIEPVADKEIADNQTETAENASAALMRSIGLDPHGNPNSVDDDPESDMDAHVGVDVDDGDSDEVGGDGPDVADGDAPPQVFDPVDRHDDLKQIFGIGPVTEKALNELGITSYSQLAELKRHDIETIAQALEIFPSRIERDDWVGNARRQLEDVLEEL